MQKEPNQLKAAVDFILNYGHEILIASMIFLGGLIAVKVVMAYVKKTLPRYTTNQSMISLVSNVLHVVLLALVIAFALHFLGVPSLVIRRIFVACALIAIGFVVLLRPYIPSLPFKLGNTIQVGELIGKVEATTFTYTRLKTFDGKTLFIPNQVLLKNVINNFHFTPTRQVRLKVTIGYKDDLLKAKQVMKELMVADERVLKKPAPSVYVMELGDNGIYLSGRCWVENPKFLRVKSDLTERLKLRFDQEGITIPFPQRHVHIEGGSTGMGSR